VGFAIDLGREVMRWWLVLLGPVSLCGTDAFPLAKSPYAITQRAQPYQPFTVAGEQGAIFGQQDGSFEAWKFPVKIASHFQLAAELANYPIPIHLQEYAAAIEVQPERTTITYSHAAFTVKQHMFAHAKAGPVLFFEISSTRALDLTLSFTPDMLRMWPAPNFNRPNAEWVSAGESGYYILHTDSEKVTGYMALPGARPGIEAPYQERPKTYQTEFKLHFDPKTQSKQFFPLLFANSKGELDRLAEDWPRLYAEAADYYAHFFDHRLTIHTPDAEFDLAMRWAELAIDQSQVKFHDETGLVAGYFSSADSARPGFGWFFGRDTLFTLYAVNSYGDYALTKRALTFLLNRQREDGKIMHEFSQTADLVDWKATPYFYASADSTPLLIMTVEDYVRTSGDTEFLKAHWGEIQKAYAFTRAHDSDGDGIYENTEGTGWVESWPPKMPHQEIYLAALDQQSCGAMAKMAGLMNDARLAQSAGAQAALIRGKMESEYFDRDANFYAFSRNADGTLDRTATVFPALSWWNGTMSLENAGGMLSRWASDEFSTDWGMRDLSRKAGIYDPISYHQGSVWPLYTGWTAVAEYRAGRSISGYAHLMQNAMQTFTQDAGAVTELLSGDYFEPFGRSSSHQLWSSAMVLTPALRGLFGIEADALKGQLTIHPQLPATWESAELRNVPVGKDEYQVKMNRVRDKLRVEASSPTGKPYKMEWALPAIEIELPHALPMAGSRTMQPKVIGQEERARGSVFEIAAPVGTVMDLPLRMNRANVKVTGGMIRDGKLHIEVPGEGAVKVMFTW